MLLVCAAHVDHHFAATSPLLASLFVLVTRIATPTFLLLSGFVIGYLLRTSRGKVGLSLVDRGLFLLLVAHWGLGLANIAEYGWREWLLGRVSIIDAVGVALFIAVLLRRRSPAMLAALGGAMCLVSWYLANTLAPQTETGALAAAVLFEIRYADRPMIDIALVPYVGLFLIGMALSGHLHSALLAGNHAAIARRLLLFAGAAIALVGIAIAAWKIGERLAPGPFWSSELGDTLRMTLDPRVKRPPSPAYLLFYGGAGLLMLAAFFHRKPTWLIASVTPPLRLIGQASLVVFIAQDWLFFVVPKVLGFETVSAVPFWLAYLALSVYALYRLARLWRRHNGNRYLTIGLKNRGASKRLRPALQIAGAEPPGPNWRCREDGWIVPTTSVDPEPARKVSHGGR
jgi:hypothetical protein